MISPVACGLIWWLLSTPPHKHAHLKSNATKVTVTTEMVTVVLRWSLSRLSTTQSCGYSAKKSLRAACSQLPKVKMAQS